MLSSFGPSHRPVIWPVRDDCRASVSTYVPSPETQLRELCSLFPVRGRRTHHRPHLFSSVLVTLDVAIACSECELTSYTDCDIFRYDVRAATFFLYFTSATVVHGARRVGRFTKGIGTRRPC